MPTFKDANGKEWLVKLDVSTIKRIRERLNVDPVDPEGKTYTRLGNDPVLLVDTLWVACEGQAGGMTSEQFGQSFTGDTFQQATEALLTAILDFFHPEKRKFIQALAAKDQRIQHLGMEAALARLNDPELEAQAAAAIASRIDREIHEMLTRLSPATNSPDGSESTPAP